MSDPNWPGIGKMWSDWVAAGCPKAPEPKPPIFIAGVQIPCGRHGHGDSCTWDYLCGHCEAILKLSGNKEPT